MQDYQPLDLFSLCNVSKEVLGENANPAIGSQTFHGLPFQIGSSVGENEKCFFGLGSGMNSEPTDVPINATAERVTIPRDGSRRRGEQQQRLLLCAEVGGHPEPGWTLSHGTA